MVLKYNEKLNGNYEVYIDHFEFDDRDQKYDVDSYKRFTDAFSSITGRGSTLKEAEEDFLEKCTKTAKCTYHILSLIYQQVSVDRDLRERGLK